MPQFNNRNNECVKVGEREIWISRSVAMVTVVIAQCLGVRYILLAQRGKGCPDYVGKWNCPCGYLDWDEILGEGAKREIWEETGFDVDSVSKDDIIYGMDSEWSINSDTNTNNQNVTARYGFYFKTDVLPILSAANSEPNEIGALRWTELSKAGEVKWIVDGDFAFNHHRVIKLFSDIINKKDWWLLPLLCCLCFVVLACW